MTLMIGSEWISRISKEDGTRQTHSEFIQMTFFPLSYNSRIQIGSVSVIDMGRENTTQRDIDFYDTMEGIVLERNSLESRVDNVYQFGKIKHSTKCMLYVKNYLR